MRSGLADMAPLWVSALSCLLITSARALYCPPVEPPCSCASSPFEPVNIRCSGAPSLVEVLKALSAAKNSLKIDSLIINATPVHFLPPKGFQGLNIGRLVIRKANMSEIDPMAFDGQLLESITELDFSENNFTRVPSNGVASLKNLRKLTLSKNQIASLQPDSFSSYESKEKLASLDLSGNKLGIIDPTAVAPLKKLEEINLQGNLLVEVPMALRQMKGSLKNLNLALNKITYIEPFTFDLPQLESLSLEYNELTDIAPEALHGLPSLLYLYLTGNRLIRWEAELFRSLGNLRNLGIGGTAITHIPWNAFSHLSRLMRLEMSDGVVNTIDNRAFKGARFLQAVILNNNKLTEIKEDTFQGLGDLYSLDLSRNGIQRIADGAFAFLPGLRHLDLSGNDLQSMEPHTFEKTFQSSSDAKMLYLCRNPWNCNEKMDSFRRWLRDNIEMVIDKPDCTAVCKDPDWLTNWPIRFPNPPPPSNLQSRYLQHRPNLFEPKTVTNPFYPDTTSTSTLPFWPPYVFTSTTYRIESATTTAVTTPATPSFAHLQRNPPNANQPNEGREPADKIPTFIQILLGRVPGAVRKVLHLGSLAPPRSRKEHDYRFANHFADGKLK